MVVTAHDLSGEERRRLNGYVETILQKDGDSREALLHQVRDLLDRLRRSAAMIRATGEENGAHARGVIRSRRQ